MIREQLKQYIYGTLFIIDVYEDGSCGSFVNNAYVSGENFEDCVKNIKNYLNSKMVERWR